MKNLFKYIGVLFSMLLIFSCEDDKELTYAIPNDAPILLQSEDTSVNLDPNYKDNPALTLIWSHANYDAQTIPLYAIHFALDEAFETGREILSTNNRSYTWTVDELNTHKGKNQK